MTRLRPVAHSLDYGYISRVDGDRKLIEHAHQESFFRQIRAKHSLRTILDDIKDEEPDAASVDACVSSLRKLREGIVASGRLDGFAIEVFEHAVRYAILAGHSESYIPAIRHLVKDLYPMMHAHQQPGRDLVHNLYLIHLSSFTNYQEYMVERSTIYTEVVTADAVLRAQVQGNWIMWERLKGRVGILEAKLMDQNFVTFAERTITTISTAYMAVDTCWINRASGELWRNRLQDSNWSLEGDWLIFKRPPKRKVVTK